LEGAFPAALLNFSGALAFLILASAISGPLHNVFDGISATFLRDCFAGGDAAVSAGGVGGTGGVGGVGATITTPSSGAFVFGFLFFLATTPGISSSCAVPNAASVDFFLLSGLSG
jgi:hypothetical protein